MALTSKPPWSAHQDALLSGSRTKPLPQPPQSSGPDEDDMLVHTPVKVATTGDIAPTGNPTIDGVTLINGDRVLIGYGASSSHSAQYGGIWIANVAGAWARATDALNADNLKPGTIVAVRQGTVLGNSTMTHVTDPGTWSSGSLGVTAQVWASSIPTSGGGGSANSVPPYQVLDKDATVAANVESVVWQQYVNFSDFVGGHVQFRISGRVSVSGGTGEKVRVLLDGTDLTPDGTEVAAITTITTTPAVQTVLGTSIVKPSGSHLVKVSLLPPNGGNTLSASSANITLVFLA